MINKTNTVFVVLLLAAAAAAATTAAFGMSNSPSMVIGFAGALLLAGTALIGRLMNRWLGPLLGALVVLALGAMAIGVVRAEAAFISAGLLGLIATGATVALTTQLAEMRGAGSAVRSPAGESVELLRKLHDHSMLSDTAKRVLFRDRELQLLRSAIEDDINRGDYGAALRLCDDLANTFGFREEAEMYRSRLNQLSHEHQEEQVGAAMDEFQAFLDKRDWSAAHDVAARIRRLFPESHVVDELDGMIDRARDSHRRELETAFKDAAQRQNVEVAMKHLRELDRYLSREDAGRIAELAQDVIAKHRENLLVQFKLAVNDHEWAGAARIGDTIITEFPNSKMAEEVRSMIDVLRTRATQAAVASQGSAP